MNSKELLKKIVEEKTVCYFISPHLDDAVFSAGALLAYLADKTKVKVVNVFTRPGEKPYTLSAKRHLSLTGFTTHPSLLKRRKKEDRTALAQIGLSPKNLGLVEALFRKREGKSLVFDFFGRLIPEVVHLYPLFRLHVLSGRVAQEDEVVKKKLEKKLRELTGREKNFLVFCPLGVGGHVDHVLVRDVCQKLFAKIIFWSDFPYTLYARPDGEFVVTRRLKPFVFAEKISVKEKMIKAYQTQIKTGFPLAMTAYFERYFANELS